MSSHECNCEWCAYDPSEDPNWIADRAQAWYESEPDAQMRALFSLAQTMDKRSGERQMVRLAMRDRMRDLGRIK